MARCHHVFVGIDNGSLGSAHFSSWWNNESRRDLVGHCLVADHLWLGFSPSRGPLTAKGVRAITARIVQDANVIIDNVNAFALPEVRHCLAAQATLKSRRPETVVLACNTFKGTAEFGSLIALKVDDVTP
jgi:hypothetical protein